MNWRYDLSLSFCCTAVIDQFYGLFEVIPSTVEALYFLSFHKGNDGFFDGFGLATCLASFDDTGS